MYGFNDAFQNHEKFFFILQQYHESINDRFSTTILDINKELINPYSYSKEEMPKIKFSNFILEGLEEILNKIEDSTKLKIHPNHIKRMLLVKTEYLNDFDIEFDQYIIYLPQTNQIFYTSNKNLDRGIFLSHAYALFIEVPLAGIEPATHGLEVHRSVH